MAARLCGRGDDLGSDKLLAQQLLCLTLAASIIPALGFRATDPSHKSLYRDLHVRHKSVKNRITITQTLHSFPVAAIWLLKALKLLIAAGCRHLIKGIDLILRILNILPAVWVLV